ncbi:MAG: ATP-binding protein [Candidatus Omnitrophota bacterium]
MKKIKKIISIILIEILFLSNAVYAESFLFENDSLIKKSTLAPHVFINTDLFVLSFQQKLAGDEEFLKQRYPFVLQNASELLTCTEVSQVQDIMLKVVDLLGFGRTKFYEVIRYDSDEKKWYIKQEIKTQSKSEGSERYRDQGPASDEKEYVLNRASREGIDFFYEKNRWAHLIGDAKADAAYVDPRLIGLDVIEFGQGKRERVKEFAHIVLRDSKGKILGILSVDNWRKPLASNPELSEPIFLADSESQSKIKILKIFAQLSGLALQRIRFKEKEQDIDKLYESEQILREILHDLKNKIMKIGALARGIKSQDIKQRFKARVIAIEGFFKSFGLRVKAGKSKINVAAVLRNDGSFERVFQVIEEVVVLIRGQDPEQVGNLFLKYYGQLKAEIRAEGKAVSPEQQDFYDFLEGFEALAKYQAGLFDRQEQLFIIHQEIQKTWSEIEQEIFDLKNNEEYKSNPDMKMVFEKVFAAYQEARIEYEKYINLCKELASNGFLQKPFNYQELNINDLMAVIDERWLRDKLESSITIAPSLPKVITDKEILISVFNELIINAQKYGGDSVTIDINLDKKQKDFLRIDFTTKGRGILEQEWKKVFIDGYRVVDDDGLGTGLGLNIVKKNIERVGGKIWISGSRLQKGSQEGGTTFSIEIPVAKEVSSIKKDFLKADLLERKTINGNLFVDASV